MPEPHAAARGAPWFARMRLPSLCALCRQWGSERLCADCIALHAAPRPRCRRCALPAGDGGCGACVIDPPDFDGAVAAVDYGYPFDALIRRYKFHAGLDLTATFARRMLAAHARAGLPSPGLLLPVPLSAQRLRERGYNQAWELARRLGRALGVPSDARLLLRIRDTPQQLDLPPEQRAANVRGAFAIEPARRAELRGAAVTVVDDVLTTGATLREVARVLRQAGAAQVHVWTLARTPRPETA